jgi:hypothetical protein
MSVSPPERARAPSFHLPSSQDFAGGLFLVFVGAFALWQGWKLPMGTLRSMGPGMLPKTLACVLIAYGLGFAVYGLTTEGENLGAWSVRGLLFIVASIIVFALTIQSMGLIVAGPASMLVAMMASPDIRWGEGAVFCVVMTGLCALMFKTLLGLPIPFNNLW